MPQRARERESCRCVALPPLKTRPSLNDIVKILARRPQNPLSLSSVSCLPSPLTVVIDHVRQEKTPCLDVVIGYASFLQPALSFCLCGAAILNPEATLMLQFRASYDLFLMPPPPTPLLVHLLSTSSVLSLCFAALSVSVFHTNCDTFCGIWYAE